MEELKHGCRGAAQSPDCPWTAPAAAPAPRATANTAGPPQVSATRASLTPEHARKTDVSTRWRKTRGSRHLTWYNRKDKTFYLKTTNEWKTNASLLATTLRARARPWWMEWSEWACAHKPYVLSCSSLLYLKMVVVVFCPTEKGTRVIWGWRAESPLRNGGETRLDGWTVSDS